MNITIFGATGDLGGACLKQALETGHKITVLVRTPEKLSDEMRQRITVVKGDALCADDIAEVIDDETQAILFAIGVDRHSPQNLCTDANRLIFDRIKGKAIRFIWCGGGSNLLEEDDLGFGARFVQKFAELFLAKRHNDKENQLKLLARNHEIDWLGLRPLQMKKGPQKAYRLGYDKFSPFSVIHFADCADAMIKMLDDDTWLRKVPIIQY